MVYWLIIYRPRVYRPLRGY